LGCWSQFSSLILPTITIISSGQTLQSLAFSTGAGAINAYAVEVRHQAIDIPPLNLHPTSVSSLHADRLQTPLTKIAQTHSHITSGAAAGIGIGVILAVALAFAFACLFMRRRRNPNDLLNIVTPVVAQPRDNIWADGVVDDSISRSHN
jgi:uncharacterized protein (TIGR03382 family)